MDAEEVGTIGRRVRRIREAQGKSQAVIAGLAGTGTATLSRIENGKLALDNLTMIVVLANALDAIDIGRPGRVTLPVAVLRGQVAQIHQRRRACQFAGVAAELPGLIRNLHTTLATGSDHAELLDLAVYLHAHATRLWLAHAGVPADLLRRTVFLIRRLAQERDEATALGAAMFVVADALLVGGAFPLGQAELDLLTLPPTTASTAGLVSQVIVAHALAAELLAHARRDEMGRELRRMAFRAGASL